MVVADQDDIHGSKPAILATGDGEPRVEKDSDSRWVFKEQGGIPCA
jgi:hypothetical protein